MGIESLSPEDVRRELREAVTESMAPVVRLQRLMSKLSVNSAEAAELLGVSEGALKAMRSRKEGPTYSKFGTKVLYQIKDLKKYLEATGQKTNVC